MNGLRVGKSEVYERDIATLKKYREDYFRITLHKMMRRAGYEAIDGEPGKGRKNTAGNVDKLEASISRTRARVLELALCNDWEHFVTLTLSPEYHNRKDLNAYKMKLSKWLKTYNQKNRIHIKYLLIPEQHQDGNWHMHGMLKGLPVEHLQEFTEQEKLPIKMLIEIKKDINYITGPHTNQISDTYQYRRYDIWKMFPNIF